ncbi:hypothetical protein BJ912DRAFT_1140988 [Pholiota molesta]|nr:hypothetical protein BJ912DRAFT_1140988 [Pholiota molesta]
MKFGKLTLSPGQVRSFTIVTGAVLLYLLVLDPLLRPPLREMTIEDYLEAEGSSTKSREALKGDYENWLGQFLGVITTDIYMYTTPDLGETLRRVHHCGPRETYTRMNDMDAEKWHHSPGLYAIWNAKPYLLNEAVNVLKAQGKVYDYAFWNEGAAFGGSITIATGHILRASTRCLGGAPVEKFKDWQEDMGPIANPVQFSEGSFFGGSPSTVDWFDKIFYAYHNHYLAHGLFVGIDQDIFNALFLLFPERIFTVWLNDPRAPAHAGIVPSPSLVPSLERGFLGECGAEWFYYQFWLADPPARDAMRGTWMREERWRKSGWWHARKLCRVTRAMAMVDFLRTSFGESWSPPPRAVSVPGIHDV